MHAAYKTFSDTHRGADSRSKELLSKLLSFVVKKLKEKLKVRKENIVYSFTSF
jgi:hypothetical protein